jgi:predicted glutamine amidotransferase
MQDNPLKQYFRRPAVYLKLPSGGLGYAPGDIDMPENGELPVYPMTAIDEITSRTPDALFNGNAVVEIIKSCIPAIKNPWAINNIDLDPILVSIRAATHGSVMEIETKCPSCEEESKYDVNLASVLGNFKPGDYTTPLIIDELTIRFRPLNYEEMNKASMIQFEMQKMMQNLLAIDDEDERNMRSSEAIKALNDTYVEMIASTIEYVKVPQGTVMDQEFIIEFLRNCDKKTYDAIKEHSLELRESTANKPLDIKCMSCGHDYKQVISINITDFFE